MPAGHTPTPAASPSPTWTPGSAPTATAATPAPPPTWSRLACSSPSARVSLPCPRRCRGRRRADETPEHIMAERFHVRVTKDHLVFCSGHFISYEGDKCERLHGHNYRTAIEV